MGAGHSHALPESQSESTLWFALGLTSTFLIAEVISGVLLNSLALLADAAHMFTDSAALAISHQLAPRLAAALVGYGILLSLATLPMWAWVVGRLAA